jgi:hypothetical protein
VDESDPGVRALRAAQARGRAAPGMPGTVGESLNGFHKGE